MCRLPSIVGEKVDIKKPTRQGEKTINKAQRTERKTQLASR